MDVASAPRIAELSDALARPDTILFVGAGISNWSGIPTWKSLLQQLVMKAPTVSARNLATKALEREDFLESASHLFRAMGRRDFGTNVRAILQKGSPQPCEIHEAICRLGPTCFITTNFDDLLESAVALHKKERKYKILTNRHVTDVPEIIQGSARSFIFKPNGDLSDLDSLVLTKEQFREVRTQRPPSVEALKILMLSRPVVFLGFSFRDPTLIVLLDEIWATFQGMAGNFYAIVPNISEEEAQYRFETLGIRIVSYNTTGLPREHQPLLELLEVLANPDVKPITSAEAANRLSLARYGSKLTQQFQVSNLEEFPIGLSPVRSSGRRGVGHYRDVHKFLRRQGENAVLVGMPGAGKTHACRFVTAELGQELRDSISGESSQARLNIPILFDLRQYSGTLEAEILRDLPPGLQLAELSLRDEVHIFLDGFNEAPTALRPKLLAEISSLAMANPHATITVTSRSAEDLEGLGWPAQVVDNLPAEVVDQYIAKHKIRIVETEAGEISHVLRIPFMFSLLKRFAHEGDELNTPLQLYERYFQELQPGWETQTVGAPPLVDVLSPLAYRLLLVGKETLTAMELSSRLTYTIGREAAAPDVESARAWLVAKNVLVPLTSSRLAFPHQTITEFLAARQLAENFRRDPGCLQEALESVRWNQAILLTIPFLSKAEGDAFATAVIRADLSLAARAAGYLKHGQSAAVRKILENVLEISRADRRNNASSFQMAWALEQLPASTEHIPLLKELAKGGNSLGGVASSLLAKIPGSGVNLQTLVQAIVTIRSSDYNFASSVSKLMRGHYDRNLAEPLIKHLASIPWQEDSGYPGVNVLEELLAEAPIEEIRQYIPEGPPWTALHEALSAALAEHADPKAGKLLLELIHKKCPPAIFRLYLRLNDSDAQHEVQAIADSRKLPEILWDYVQEASDPQWGMSLIRDLRNSSTVFASAFAKLEPPESESLWRQVLFENLHNPLGEKFWNKLKKWLARPVSEVLPHAGIIEGFLVDWNAHEEELEQWLLELDWRLLRPLLEVDKEPSRLRRETTNPEALISRLLEVPPSSQLPNGIGPMSELWFYRDRLGRFLAELPGSNIRTTALEMVGKSDPEKRTILLEHLLLHMDHVTTDELQPEVVDAMVLEMNKRRAGDWRGPLLASFATKKFIEAQLVPMLEDADGQFKENLLNLLESAGRIYGCRFVNSEARLKRPKH